MSSLTKKNLPASVLARLKNISKKQKFNFNILLIRYGVERFLYRLSVSPYSSSFILKGASLFTIWFEPSYRTTKDADFCCIDDAKEINLTQCFREVCAIQSNDGVIFDMESIAMEQIRKAIPYGGMTITVTAYIANVKIPLQFDIGFGDAIYPDAELSEFPTLLETDPPQIKAYSSFTVIAEKFQAMVTLNLANSRMKDFYDIWLLAKLSDFDFNTLTEAIQQSFNNRNIIIPSEEYPLALTSTFADSADKQRQWEAFCRKINPKDAPKLLSDVIDYLRIFFKPIIFESTTPPKIWHAGKGWQQD